MLPDAYITQLAAAAHASGAPNTFHSILFSPVFLSLCIMPLLLPRLLAPHPRPGALLVLDCIASGCMWVDMKVSHAPSCVGAERDFGMRCKGIQPLTISPQATGVDVLISAPQKGSRFWVQFSTSSTRSFIYLICSIETVVIFGCQAGAAPLAALSSSCRLLPATESRQLQGFYNGFWVLLFATPPITPPSTSTSFCCDLKKWLEIMETYFPTPTIIPH